MKEKLTAIWKSIKESPGHALNRLRELITGNKTVASGIILSLVVLLIPGISAWIASEPKVAALLMIQIFLTLRIYTRTAITQSNN